MTNDLFALDGKVALVTGGATGIGRMIAEGYVHAGVRTYIASRKLDACVATAEELAEFGTCIALEANLATSDGAAALVAQLTERESALHILVNNAGATWGAPLADTDEAAWERVLSLNVKGVFHLTREAAPLLAAGAAAGDPSRVINVGSIDGLRVPAMETYAYSASKAAVHQLTRHLARRLAPTTTVNAIAPGPFPSKMMRATLDAFGEQIAAATPMKRVGEPSDMAGAAIYLASRAGSYATGSILVVDGGLSITG